jgi:hypothetical protein
MSATHDVGHLDEAVRPDLLLSDEHRIARIDRDRWIGYGRAREAIEELARILRSERRQRPDNLLIVGASNNGKTAIARRFIARMLPPENPDARYSTIPVALIQAPNGPRIPQLLTSIRAALGQPAGRRESTPSAGIPPALQAEPWPASPSFAPKLTGSCVASASGCS